MKKIKIISIILICSLVFNSIIYAEQADKEKEYVIITEKDEVSTVLEEEGISKGQSVCIDDGSVGVIETSLSSVEAEEVAENDNVLLIEENIELTGDTEQGSQEGALAENEEATWNIQMVNAAQVKKSKKNKIKVGVIDSGICYSSDISISGGKDFTEGEEESYFLYEDLSGHGTSVAGVIASKNSYGINQNVELYSIKVMNGDNKTTLSKVIQGIYWSIDNDMDIINLSLGTTQYSQVLEQAINDAYRAGLLIVASAGNGESISYPAAYANVIAVGSIDNNGNIVSQNADLYNNIIFAPGENIVTNATFETAHVKSGTSMAAPHITALAAVLWKKYLDEKMNLGDSADKVENINDFIRSLLYASAKTIEGDALVADLGFAQEQFADFLNNYTPNAQTDLGGISGAPENNQLLETFEDSEVEALWGGSGHAGTIDGISYTYMNAAKQTFLKQMAIAPDIDIKELNVVTSIRDKGNLLGLNWGSSIPLSKSSETFAVQPEVLLNNQGKFDEMMGLRKLSILHGRGNYVASLKFLYTVARNLSVNQYSGYSNLNMIRQAILEAVSQSDINNSCFYGSTYNFRHPDLNWSDSNGDSYDEIHLTNTKVFSSEEQRLWLERMIYLTCNTVFDGEEALSNLSFREKSSLKVLGLAIHLAGDTYAHKTTVPKNIQFNSSTNPSTRDSTTIYLGKAGCDFNGRGRWNKSYGIKTLVGPTGNNDLISPITTQQISEWQIDSKSEDAMEYPDYTQFLSSRYNYGACALVYNIVSNYCTNNSFSFDWYLTIGGSINTNNVLRLANLWAYAKVINVVPTDATKKDKLKQLDSLPAISDINNGTTSINWHTGVLNSAS